MTTVELYNTLKSKFDPEPFELKALDLEALSPGVQAAKAVAAMRRYFPGGTIKLTARAKVNRPGEGKRIEVTGSASATPFAGLSLRLELWVEPTSGTPELHLAVSAWAASFGAQWVLGQAIPFYQGTLLEGLKLAILDDSQHPFLTLTSHPTGGDGSPVLRCRAFVDLSSISGITPSLLLADEATDKAAFIRGTIAAFEPFDSGPDTGFRPFVYLNGGLPKPDKETKFADRFRIDNVRYLLNAKPDFNLATWQPAPVCSVRWLADLELKPPTGADPSRSYVLPIGAEIAHGGGRIRFSAGLKNGLAYAWDALAQCIPGMPASLPDTGFTLQDDIRLTDLEVYMNRSAHRGLELDSISLRVQTNEDRNRWVLIPNLLTLDGIDFYVQVNAAGTGVYLMLTGLVGIGPKATLKLTGDLSHAGGTTDYGFSGLLLDGEPLEIKEVLTHFLGHSPDIPQIYVDDFSFSVRPRSRFYEGEITLSGDWKLTDMLTLREVYFLLRHDGGEGDTTFEANGVFDLGGAEIFVAAEYASNGQGWTFSGGTIEGQEIEAGTWIEDVWKRWSPAQKPSLPESIKSLVLKDLGVRFNTATKDYSFEGTGRFSIGGEEGHQTKAELTVQVRREADRATLRGILSILDREFEVAFDTSGLLVATYDGTGAKPVDLRDLVTEISKDLGGLITSGILIDLRHAQLAYSRKTDDRKFLFSMNLDAGIQLSNLPLVGCLFARTQTLNVAFRLVAVNKTFTAQEIRAINDLSGPDMTKLPETAIGGSNPADSDFSLKAAVTFSGTTHQLAMPLSTDVKTKPESGKVPVASDRSRGGSSKATYWVKIDKALGPFHFERLGLATDGTALAFVLDAGLKTAGLAITLDGLEASCTFADLSKGEFHPSFDLRGLGIAFKSGELEIGGALLRRPNTKDAFDGAVTLRYKRFGLQAVGSYERTADGRASLFVYALIDYPLGGPAFFYVEGGAAGFGYNRSLKVPSIEQLSQFPLVEQALSTDKSKRKPVDLARDLNDHILVSAGQYFIAVGIKFTSFKSVKGFVLLTVLFGEHFEIDVLGKATLIGPPGAESSKALLSATLLLLARFRPEDGLLMVAAQLAPDAHLFSPDCLLTGGFALYCWFDGPHKGDFVLTLGGYHGNFAVPPHYPHVPRLGINWRVNPNLSIKAEAYFALTPAALMAGGRLEVNWQSGDLEAWFRAELDFMIGWQPYFYDGHAYVAIGARYRFNLFGKQEISAELSAKLDVWGPPFSGRARVKWTFISFEITFGDPEPQPPKPLTWPEFKTSFLPEKKIFTFTADAGKVTQGDGSAKAEEGRLGSFNPRSLCIGIRSPLPVKIEGSGPLHMVDLPELGSALTPVLGIAPMNLAAAKWDSTVTVRVFRGKDDVSARFEATRTRASVPASMWGETMDPKARKKDAPHLIAVAITGYELRPFNPVDSVSPTGFRIQGTKLKLDLAKAEQCRMVQGRAAADAGKIIESLIDPKVQQRRGDILKRLLPEADVKFSSITIASWRGTPSQILPNPDREKPDAGNIQFE